MEGEKIISQLNEDMRNFKSALERENRILVVDDEDVVLMVLEELLTGEGYKTSLAKSGEEGIKQLQKSPFNLVVTDKNLPGISGLDVIRHCKELNPLIEILMITGYASLESALEAIGRGAYDYLTKPFENLDVLRIKIKKAVGKQNRTLINRKIVSELKKLTDEFMKRDGVKEKQRHIVGRFAAELERFKRELGKRNRILVIDEDEQVGGVTTRFLQEQGYDVTFKASGEEGIDFLKEHGANLIITDKDLPGMDGFALIEKAKEIDPDIGVMMIASGSSLDTVLKAVDKGACDYLLKPLEGLNVLLTKVKKTLKEQNDNLQYKKLIQELRTLSKEALHFAQEAERQKSFFEELTEEEEELLEGLGAGPPRSPEEIEADKPIVIKVAPKGSQEKFEQFMEEVKPETTPEEKTVELKPEPVDLKLKKVEEEAPTRIRVLIVDDEDVVLKVMKELLAGEGYEVELSLSGEEGLDLLKNRSFDLMLIDKNLPGISGLDLIGSAKKVDPEMEFIMMTAYGSLQSAMMAMELGVCSYILKPLDDVKNISQVVGWAAHKRREKIKLKKKVEQLMKENQLLKQELIGLKKRIKLDA
ncbi:MAG: response regulator [Deltaproteobacteria bacterium]|nr:MAG: response regulator [Deltaproteobacteria bacterium]